MKHFAQAAAWGQQTLTDLSVTPLVFLCTLAPLMWLFPVTYRWFPILTFVDRWQIPFLREPPTPSALVLPLLTILAVLLLVRLRFLPKHNLLFWIPLGTLLLALPFFFTKPLGSQDVYAYGYYGRLAATYQVNPYTIDAQTVLHDPYLDATLADHTFQTSYGPLWTSLEGLVIRIAGTHVQFSVLLFRILGLGSLLGIVFLLWRMLPKNSLSSLALVAVAWNPYVLFEVVSNAHNDTWMMLWVVLALFAVYKKWYLFAPLALTVAGLMKFVPFLFVPVFFVVLIRAVYRDKQFRELSVGVLLSALLTVLAFMPYWSGLATFHTLFLLGGTFTLPFYHPLQLIAWFVQLLGVDGLQSTFVARVVGSTIGLLLSAFVLFLAFRKKQLSLALLLVVQSAVLLALFVVYFQPWYLLWVLLLLPLLQKRPALQAIFFVSVLAAITYAVY